MPYRMDRRVNPQCRARAAAGLAVVASAATFLAPAVATAGRAQAGSSAGLYSTWDLLSGATTGQGFRDGGLVQSVDVSGDPSSASIQVYDGLSNAGVRLDSQGVLSQPGGPGLPFSGHKAVEADRAGGVLRLAGSSTFTGYDANGYRREAWVSGYSWAEVVESFEVFYPANRAEPVTATLRFTVDGSMTGNAGDNGRVNGLQLYAILGNTDQGAGQVPGLSPAIWRTETGASGHEVSVTGTLLNPNCPMGKDWCQSFVTLYAGLDMRSRVASSGEIQYTPTGAPFGADFTARMALEFSPGVTVLQFDNRGEYEALHSWVNVAAPVPEPGAWAFLLAGLAGVAARVRRRPLSPPPRASCAPA